MSVRPRLTVERLFSDPPIAVLPPSRLRFSPDGAHLAWLMPASEQRGRLELWIADCSTRVCRRLFDPRILSPGSTSEADRERQERQRQFASGVTTYEWFPDGKSVLVPLGSSVFRINLDGEATALTPDSEEPGDLRLSPQGNFLTWVTGGNLFFMSIASRAITQVTQDGSETVTNGLAEFIAQEEMHRFEGYWWAPDESRLVFTRTDTSPIPHSYRMEVVKDSVTAVAQRYPFAGGNNAKVTLHEYRVSNHELRSIDPGIDPESYLARIGFIGGSLVAQVQTREQQYLELLGETDNGDFVPWMSESSATWINLHDNLTELSDARFLWTSERTGLSRLMTGSRGEPDSLRFASPEDVHVTSVLGASGDVVWTQGWQGNPTERHLFETDLRSGATQRHTQESGWHDGVLHPSTRRYASVYSSTVCLPELRLTELSDNTTHILLKVPADHPARTWQPPAPQFGSIPASDGQQLWWRLTPPAEVQTAKLNPVVVYVYGGPGAQKACNATLPGLITLLSDAGYGVLELDNRGSANRGRNFEAPLYLRMGGVEVEDQLRGIDVLRQCGWADLSRVAVFGHSYGGFMALMCITRHPEVFKAGVAVAPVSDWKLYDTHYTERYLGNPSTDDSAYINSSVMPHLKSLSRPLLLVHGMADDNVLVTHTTKVMAELQKHGKPFELMLYPGSRHALQEREVSIHRFNQMLDFLAKHLG